MAYLQELGVQCHTMGCVKHATYELFDWFNESRGKFCTYHASQELEKREDFENTHNRCDGTKKEKNYA